MTLVAQLSEAKVEYEVAKKEWAAANRHFEDRMNYGTQEESDRALKAMQKASKHMDTAFAAWKLIAGKF